MLLYHRTDPEAARRIAETGRFTSRENTGEVFFSDRDEGHAHGYGQALVVVDVPGWMARLDDEFPDGERHYAVRADDLIGRLRRVEHGGGAAHWAVAVPDPLAGLDPGHAAELIERARLMLLPDGGLRVAAPAPGEAAWQHATAYELRHWDAARDRFRVDWDALTDAHRAVVRERAHPAPRRRAR